MEFFGLSSGQIWHPNKGCVDEVFERGSSNPKLDVVMNNEK